MEIVVHCQNQKFSVYETSGNIWPCVKHDEMLQNTGVNSSGFFMWAESTLMFIFKGKLKEKFKCCFLKG